MKRRLYLVKNDDAGAAKAAPFFGFEGFEFLAIGAAAILIGLLVASLMEKKPSLFSERPEFE